MTVRSALATPEVLRWLCDSPALPVECAPDLLEKICFEAVNGFKRLAHGGIEVGGILYGVRNSAVRVRALRPIPCEHKLGPSFILSESDEAALRESLRTAGQDPDFAALEPVGCYLSHSRRGFTLADSDLTLLNRYFPGSWQFVLLLVPAKSAPTRIGLFTRDTAGVFVCRHEFTYSTPADGSSSEGQMVRIPTPAEIMPLAETSAEDRRENALARFNTFLEGQERQRRVGRWNLAASIAILLLCLAGLAYAWWRARPAAAPTTMPMRVSGTDNQLKVDWDPAAEPIQTATRGVLEIRDGDAALVRLPVARDVLRNGTVYYTRHSDRVELRLRLLRGDSEVSESVVYFINPIAVQPAPTEPPQSPVVYAQAIPPPTPREVQQPMREPVPEADRFQPTRVFRAPPAQRSVHSDTTILPAVPDVEIAASPKPVLPFAVTAPPPPPAVVHKPAQPRFGRIIWTGELRRGAILSFSAQGPSAGTINGALPGGPVKVSVFPAELIDGGIVIYTSSPKVPKAELPSALNGWNTVLYKYDTKRAADLQLVQPPAASNEWSQLVVRNGNRPLSVIVLDWSRSEN